MNRLAFVLLAASVLHAAESAPQWVLDAAKQPAPAYPPSVTAVVVLHEERLAVDADGARTATERGAIRILQQSKESVSALRTYNAKSGRIRQFTGWIVSPDGKAATLKKELVTDQSMSQGNLYDEYRAKALSCGSGVPTGSLFAYEVVEEERTVFTHYYYDFQDSLPVLRSRFVLTLPPGWETKSAVFGEAQVRPAEAPGTWTWEARDLPPVEPEDYSPPRYSLEPRVWIAYCPSGGSAPAVKPLKDWRAVSEWTSEFMDPAAAPSDAVSAKAAELTRGASTELQKIAAIAAFVQQTNYVSVQMNLTRGGGYTPNAATKVLSRNYGDCKDKATLMRALLKAVGIDSYVTSIRAGDRNFVKPEWPSPMQFNHAIVAVRATPEIRLPTVLEHPRLGRLLIFDPTSEHTPLGDLPEEEQGSWALVLAGAAGELVRMPLLPASANRTETRVEATLAVDGSVQASLARVYHGQSATPMRSLHKERPDELKRVFETSLARRLGGSEVASVTSSDRMEQNEFEAQVRFSARQFGQLMQGRLLVLRPGTLAASNDYGFPAKERKTPVKLRSRVRHDRIAVTVPAGFAADEVPDPILMESPLGKYSAKWSVDGSLVTLEQSIDIADSVRPASEYGAVRDFFERVAAAQNSSVVLIRSR